jgi:hypothetical protein
MSENLSQHSIVTGFAFAGNLFRFYTVPAQDDRESASEIPRVVILKVIVSISTFSIKRIQIICRNSPVIAFQLPMLNFTFFKKNYCILFNFF